MSKIKLMTDSACDLTAQQEKDCNIKMMNFKVAVGDDSYTSRIDFDNAGFYKIMEGYDGLPSTSQITEYEFENAFEELYNDGYDAVVYMSINKNASATYDNACMARNSFFENHKEAVGKFNIGIVDSRNYTCAYGYPLVQAAGMIERGADFDEIVRYLNDWAENVMIYFAPYSLKYAKKSGRIPSAAAFVGEMLGLRPIMKIYDGAITTYDKVRGDRAVVPRIVDHALETMIPQTPYCLIYGSDESILKELEDECIKRFGYPPEFATQIGAAVAINAGPVVAGVMFRKNS